jgi:hypothetical protein
MPALLAIRGLPGHVFWPDRLSMADPAFFSVAQLSNHARVTDSYLLALALANKGKLATLDTRLAVDVVPAAAGALALI